MARTTKILATTVAAILIAATANAAQAGQFSINLNPGNAEQQQMMQMGLGFYSLVQDIENGSITQNGTKNSAGLTQGGTGNLGIIHQEGNQHNGTVTQNGNNNSYGLFQFGKGTNAQVNQGGGQSGLGFIFGW